MTGTQPSQGDPPPSQSRTCISPAPLAQVILERRVRARTLDTFELIRRFLQHVLPTGLMKVRYYGLLSPNAKLPLAELKARIELAHAFTVTASDIELAPWPETPCQACGSKLRFHKSLRIYRSANAAARGAGPPPSALTPAIR